MPCSSSTARLLDIVLAFVDAPLSPVSLNAPLTPPPSPLPVPCPSLLASRTDVNENNEDRPVLNELKPAGQLVVNQITLTELVVSHLALAVVLLAATGLYLWQQSPVGQP